jgi:hypothetical protein
LIIALVAPAGVSSPPPATRSTTASARSRFNFTPPPLEARATRSSTASARSPIPASTSPPAALPACSPSVARRAAIFQTDVVNRLEMATREKNAMASTIETQRIRILRGEENARSLKNDVQFNATIAEVLLRESQTATECISELRTQLHDLEKKVDEATARTYLAESRVADAERINTVSMVLCIGREFLLKSQIAMNFVTI